MRNKPFITSLFAIVATVVVWIICFTHFLSNSWNLFTDCQYFIPNESTIFSFRPTKMNEGSGGWWLYGEDKQYYYGLNVEPGSQPEYFKQKKGEEPSNFDCINYKTWRKKDLRERK